jgi:hypothetical protein
MGPEMAPRIEEHPIRESEDVEREDILRAMEAALAQPRQRSYQASAETVGILRELRAAFGLSTDSAVIRRALALARVIARAAQGADSILIRRNDGREQEIILRE